MRRLISALLLTLILAPLLWAAPLSAAPHTQQQPCLFFTETGGGQGGFAVCDDGAARFRTAFQRWGLQRVGYPISRRYERDGFVTQAFQKAIMQWRPESGSVVLVNIFDDLSRAALDQPLAERYQTPVPLPAGWDGEIPFAQVVQKRQALLASRPALSRAYFAAADPLTFFGLPTSEVTDMGNHYAIRLQRTVLQEWKEDVPWAKAGQVTIANGGDIAKTLGGLPAEVLLPEPALSYQPEPTPVVHQRIAVPVRIKIPSLNIDASIESVGKDNQGRVDVPRGVMNAAWYNLLARPGEVGNAIMTGHLDDYKSQPAVFWRLNELRVGDAILVVDADGQTHRFEVLDKAIYGYNDPAPMEQIYGFTLKRNLNIITCNGTWDAKNWNYDKRLVIYARAVD
ncbi:MAG: class F sortase [Ardenticatenales bacterium]|nr:class F sortase [Ardenticatenales bacterium]